MYGDQTWVQSSLPRAILSLDEQHDSCVHILSINQTRFILVLNSELPQSLLWCSPAAFQNAWVAATVRIGYLRIVSLYLKAMFFCWLHQSMNFNIHWWGLQSNATGLELKYPEMLLSGDEKMECDTAIVTTCQGAAATMMRT